jgi:hypothetical protein
MFWRSGHAEQQAAVLPVGEKIITLNVELLNLYGLREAEGIDFSGMR